MPVPDSCSEAVDHVPMVRHQPSSGRPVAFDEPRRRRFLLPPLAAGRKRSRARRSKRDGISKQLHCAPKQLPTPQSRPVRPNRRGPVLVYRSGLAGNRSKPVEFKNHSATGSDRFIGQFGWYTASLMIFSDG